MDLCLEPSILDLGIDVIHAYDSQPSTINVISISHISHELYSLVIRQLYDSREIERNLIDSDSLVASEDVIHIYNLESLEVEIPSLRVILNGLVTKKTIEL